MSATYIRQCKAFRADEGRDIYALFQETAESNIGKGDNYSWFPSSAGTFEEIIDRENAQAKRFKDQGVFWQPGKNASAKHHMREIEESLSLAQTIKTDEPIWLNKWRNITAADRESEQERLLIEAMPIEGFKLEKGLYEWANSWLKCQTRLDTLPQGIRFYDAITRISHRESPLFGYAGTTKEPKLDALLDKLAGLMKTQAAF